MADTPPPSTLRPFDELRAQGSGQAFPTATAENRGGLTILCCGRCRAHAVRVPPLPPDQDWHCPWCGCRQPVEWQPAEAVRA